MADPSTTPDARQLAEALSQSNKRHTFLLKLSDAVRPLADPLAIQTTGVRLLGEHLGVDRAYYTEVFEDRGASRVRWDYLRGDSPSLVGEYRMADFGWVVPPMRRGEILVIADVEQSHLVPEGDRAAMAAVRIAAHVNVPLVKVGILVGAVCVTEPRPRAWRQDEVDLVVETAERIWAAAERARAEEALRESEAKYRTLFQSIDAGFALIEFLDGGESELADFRFLEVNEGFERQTGNKNVAGKLGSEINTGPDAV